MSAKKLLSKIAFIACLSVGFSLSSCTETITKTLDDNTAISPHRIPTIKVEGYVNRLFIDLVGRSPIGDELKRETDTLIANGLSRDAREALITKLQSDTAEVEGDSSYSIAWNERFYIIVKSRMVEGAEDPEFTRYIGNASFAQRRARLEGDSIRVFAAQEVIDRNMNVITAKYDYRNDSITINEMFARMMNNNVYDNINMNTFNFVNASFDDLFFRFPTQEEFTAAFAIIERNEVGALLGGFASNKAEYCQLLTESDEFYEGLIRWAYIELLNREPTTQEVVNHFSQLVQTRDFKHLQLEILRTDEYADF